jgi:hypothetical protein
MSRWYRGAVVILPGLLLKQTHRHPTPLLDGNVRDGFWRFGADEWDALRIRFRDPRPRRLKRPL